MMTLRQRMRSNEPGRDLGEHGRGQVEALEADVLAKDLSDLDSRPPWA